MEKLSSDLLSLQAAADVAFIKENLRLRANRQLIWALIILVQALGSYPRFGSFVALGACVVLGCEAMWLLRVRQPRPVLAAALLLWATAAWNLYLSIAGFENGWIWVLLYAFFGSREYRLYRKFRLAVAAQTPQSEAEVTRITASLRVPDPNVIEPHIRGDRWLVRLFTNGLVLRNTTKGALSSPHAKLHGLPKTGIRLWVNSGKSRSSRAAGNCLVRLPPRKLPGYSTGTRG